MNIKLLVATSFLVFLAACSSNVPDPRGIPEGVQKERAITLLQRNAEDDASAFYHAGGIWIPHDFWRPPSAYWG